MIDSSLWHTDLERVKGAVSGLPYLVRYSERDYLDEWVHNGNLRIRDAGSYAADKSPDRQDWETTRSYLINRCARETQRKSRIPAPPGAQSASKVDVRAVSVEALHSCPDYWMFSMSKSLSLDMLRRFGRSCCVVIGRPEPLWARFLYEVAEQPGSKNFTAFFAEGATPESVKLPPKVATMSDVSYLGPPDELDPRSMDRSKWMKQVGDGDEFDHIFKKPAWRAHQEEVKCAWTHFDSEDIRRHNHRWRITVEDVKTAGDQQERATAPSSPACCRQIAPDRPCCGSGQSCGCRRFARR